VNSRLDVTGQTCRETPLEDGRSIGPWKVAHLGPVGAALDIELRRARPVPFN